VSVPLSSASDLASFILAAGALGTAAFGIVEASKYFSAVGEAGYPALRTVLGALTDPIQVAYGPQTDALLRAQYRGDQRDLARLMRQGARVGLRGANAGAVARDLGSIDPDGLVQAIRVAMGEDDGSGRDGSARLTNAQRSLIARYELAADARIEAALTLAQARYAGALRLMASAVAVALALVVASLVTERTSDDYALAVLVGLGAVPLAPIAKDVAAGIQAAAKAIKAKGQ
jgi:hypothetical protein